MSLRHRQSRSGTKGAGMANSNGAQCQKFSDAPHAVIMVLDQEITCEQAREIGRNLGSLGYTARFISGDIAEFGVQYAAWMRKHGYTHVRGYESID